MNGKITKKQILLNEKAKKAKEITLEEYKELSASSLEDAAKRAVNCADANVRDLAYLYLLRKEEFEEYLKKIGYEFY